MTAGLAIPNFPTLIVISAIGYAVAAVGMKLASQSQSPLSIALVVAGFAVATLAEMVLLREGNLAMIYLVIIGLETLLVLAAAWYLGDHLSGSQILGGAFLLAGVALVAH